MYIWCINPFFFLVRVKNEWGVSELKIDISRGWSEE
jgi:hypothetical protein